MFILQIAAGNSHRGVHTMRYAKLALLMLVTACAVLSGPTVRVTKLWPEPLEPRPAGYEIRIYQEKQPRCAFDEIARLSTDQTADIHTGDALAEILRVKARELGGDAIINLASETRTAGATGTDGQVTLEKTPVWSGTVIRFKSLKCAE
jgi:hypothetical protein